MSLINIDIILDQEWSNEWCRGGSRSLYFWSCFQTEFEYFKKPSEGPPLVVFILLPYLMSGASCSGGRPGSSPAPAVWTQSPAATSLVNTEDR